MSALPRVKRTRARRVQGAFGLALDRAAERHPDAKVWLDQPLAAAPDGGLAWSVAGLAQLAALTSGRLAAAGVGRDDRVAVLVPNGLDVHILMYAALRLGAVPALLSDRLSPEAVEHCLRVLRPRLVVCGPALLMRHETALVRARADGCEVLLSGVPSIGPPADARSLAECAPLAEPALRPKVGQEPAIVIHSSGTTGMPKLVLHSADSARAIGVCGRYQTFARLMPVGPHDTVAASLTFTHVRAALGHQLALELGCSLLLIAEADAPDLAERIGRIGPTLVETHPNVFMRWERLAAHPARPFARTQMFVATADVLHARTVRRLLAASERRHPVFAEVYGMSETGPATIRVHRRGRGRPPRVSTGRDVGRPIPGFSRLRVVDPATGQNLPPGRTGPIEIATRGRMLAYLNDAGPVQASAAGAWFRTGDVGSRTNLGRVRLHDRAADRVPCVESCIVIEDALLLAIDELEEVVVVRGNDDRSVIPVVATRSGRPLSPSVWRAAVADLPVPLADPVLLPVDRIPQTPTQKVRRFLLRELLAEEPA